MTVRSVSRMVMFTGPAGAVKTTLARAWCAEAVHRLVADRS